MNKRDKNVDFGIVLSLGLLLAVFWAPEQHFYIKLTIFSLLITILIPVIFTPFARLWGWIGRQIEKVSSMLVLGVLFFCVLTPISFLMRFFRMDPLRLRPKRNGAGSFFIQRVKRFEETDFKQQF